MIILIPNDVSNGALPQTPVTPDSYRDVLTQKSNQKKSIRQLADASLEKLAFSWLKPSKLAPTSLKQDSFKRQLHWFFGSPDEVAR